MPARATPARARIATAYAPGHVTGVFAPDLTARDPRGRGSVGAGIVLELGVRAMARWRPGRRGTTVRVVSETRRTLPISEDVAQRLVAARPGELDVAIRHDLPIGQGFGMSAAGALATGLAVAAVLKLSRQRAIETAHLADLFGGGGLGGVAAILGGGLEIRDRPGVPPRGRVRHRPFDASIFLVVVGTALPSPRLLRDDRFLDRVRAQASRALPRLRSSPDARTFLAEAERFTDGLDLAPLELRRLMSRIRATGARAAQSMFGESLFIVPRTPGQRSSVLRVLERANRRAIEIRSAALGAHLGASPSRAARGSVVRGRAVESLLDEVRVAPDP